MPIQPGWLVYRAPGGWSAFEVLAYVCERDRLARGQFGIGGGDTRDEL